MNSLLITLIFTSFAINQGAMAQSRLLDGVKRNPDEAKSICQNFRELNKKNIELNSIIKKLDFVIVDFGGAKKIKGLYIIYRELSNRGFDDRLYQDVIDIALAQKPFADHLQPIFQNYRVESLFLP